MVGVKVNNDSNGCYCAVLFSFFFFAVDVDVDVDVLSHGNALTAGAHPGNIESGLLKNYGPSFDLTKGVAPFCSALPFFSRLLSPRCCLMYHAP